MIGTAGRVAELLHPGLKVAARTERLAIRHTHGVPGTAVDLARVAGTALARSHYLQLARAGLIDAPSIGSASDDEILRCVGNDHDRLSIVKEVERTLAVTPNIETAIPELPTYAA